MPYLSIIVPVYNRARELEKCLETIRASDYKDYELIVVDDGSIDESLMVAESMRIKALSIKRILGALRRVIVELIWFKVRLLPILILILLFFRYAAKDYELFCIAS